MGAIRGRVVLWLSFVVGFLGVLVVVFVPPVTLSSEYSWDVVRGEPVVTGLVRPAVEEITVVGSCGLGGGASSEVLEADNWSVTVRGQVLEVASPLGGNVILASVLPGSCGFEVVYSLTDMAVSVTVVDDSSSGVVSEKFVVVPEAFRVSGFGVSGVGEPVFEQVVVETFPWGLGFSPVRFTVQVLLFGAVGLLIVRTIVRDRASASLGGEVRVFPQVGSRWSRWTVHGVVLVALVGGMMLFPSHFDDGWVFHRISGSLSSGVLSDPYLEGSWVVQLIWMEKSVAALLRFGADFVTLKIVFAVVVWLGWLAAAKAFRMVMASPSMSALIVLAAIYLAFSLAFLVTIRREPFVTGLVALFFVGFIGYVRQLREPYLLLAGLSAVAAGTLHQSGFVLIFPTLLLLGFSFWQARKRSVRWASVLEPVVTALLFGFALALLDYDLRTLIREVQAPLNQPDYVAPEWARWERLLGEPGWAWFPIVLGALVLLVLIGRFNRLTSSEKWIVMAVVSAPLGLFFALSKWPTHLAVLAVPMGLLAVIFANHSAGIFRGGRGSGSRVALLTAAGVLSILAISSEDIRHWVYPYRELSSGLIQEVLPDSWFGVLLIAVPLLGLTGYMVGILPNGFVSSMMSATLVGIILAPAGNHYGMLAADSYIYGGWSPLKQRVMDISGTPNCGLLDDVSIVVGARQVVSADGKETVDLQGPFDVDVYSIERVEESVRFDLSGDRETLALWVKPLRRHGEVLVELNDGQGGTRYIQLENLDDEMWRLVSVPQPSRWATIDVRPVAQPRDYKGVLVTVLSEVDLESSTQSITGSAVFSGPMVNTYIPCAREPEIIKGVWEGSDYLFRNNWGWPIGSEGVHGTLVEVAYREGVRGSFISLVKVVDK